MTVQGYTRTTVILLLVSIAIGFVSLALPWWTFIMFSEGKLISTFNLFLLGIIKIGFVKASLSYEWWSYTTFALVALGAFLGLAGYRFLAMDKKNGRKLVALEAIFTISGCLLYLGSLFFTFATAFSNFHDFWITFPPGSYGSVQIALLNAFSVRYSFDGRITVYEFLSIGFFFAVISCILSLVVLYRLTKTQASSTDYSTTIHEINTASSYGLQKETLWHKVDDCFMLT